MSQKTAVPLRSPIEIEIKVVKGERANWFVKPTKVPPGSTVTWHCPNSDFVIWFPGKKNPLTGGTNELYSRQGKASAVVGFKTDTYYYTVLAKDQKGATHLIEGNSPPEMIIQ
jgi:hypothetical protein